MFLVRFRKKVKFSNDISAQSNDRLRCCCCCFWLLMLFFLLTLISRFLPLTVLPAWCDCTVLTRFCWYTQRADALEFRSGLGRRKSATRTPRATLSKKKKKRTAQTFAGYHLRNAVLNTLPHSGGPKHCDEVTGTIIISQQWSRIVTNDDNLGSDNHF